MDGIAIGFRELSMYVGRLRKKSVNAADVRSGAFCKAVRALGMPHSRKSPDPQNLESSNSQAAIRRRRAGSAKLYHAS